MNGNEFLLNIISMAFSVLLHLNCNECVFILDGKRNFEFEGNEILSLKSSVIE